MEIKYGIYGYFYEGECIYIGVSKFIDDNQRHRNHLKPSKMLEQPINEFLQNNDNWIYKVLYSPEYPNLIDDSLKKTNIHHLEQGLIKRYQPKYNKYGKE